MSDIIDQPVAAQPAPMAPVPAPQRRLRIPTFSLSFKEVVVMLLIVNGFVTGGLWLAVQNNKPPVIATVGVTRLTRLYTDSLAADPNTTPEERAAKTGIFMQTTRKTIQDLATKRGVVVLARECVLTGEHEDLTPQLEQAVHQVLATPSAGPQTGGLDETLVQ